MAEFRRIETSEWNSRDTRVTIVGFLDEKLSGPTLLQELVQELNTLLDRMEGSHILLNLSRVEFISSAALNRLINFQKRIRGAGNELKLCDLRPSIENVFVATRLNQVFDIQRTEDEALASFKAAP
jgi:anti-sigma B factor antagonist